MIAFILAVLSALSGLYAAKKWYDASAVNYELFQKGSDGTPLGLSTDNSQHWIESFRRTLRRAGKKNRAAAIWTTASIALAGLSALANAWP